MMFRSLIVALLLSFCSFSYGMDRLPIHEAAMQGDADAVTRILDEDPSMINRIEEWGFGFTPLHWAAMKQHKNVIRVLLKRGADRNIRDLYEGHKPWDYVIVRRVAIELETESQLMHQAQHALLMGGHQRLGANSPLQTIHQMLPQIAQYLRPEHFQDPAVQAASSVVIPTQSLSSRTRESFSDLREAYYYLSLIIKEAFGYQ